jgi:hypothetical protein
VVEYSVSSARLKLGITIKSSPAEADALAVRDSPEAFENAIVDEDACVLTFPDIIEHM